MKRKFWLTLLVLIVVALSMGVSLTGAQDAEPTVVTISGTYDYFPEILSEIVRDGYIYWHAIDEEVYVGDFDGTATSVYRVIVEPDGRWDGWILTDFEGTVLGDMEGTMQIMYTYTLLSAGAEWYGEWWILDGTGGLENVHGTGYVWGPGFNPEDPEASPMIYYSGELIIPEE